MTHQQMFISALYMLYNVIVLFYLAYKLCKVDYLNQTVHILTWMAGVSLFVVVVFAYSRQL